MKKKIILIAVAFLLVVKVEFVAMGAEYFSDFANRKTAAVYELSPVTYGEAVNPKMQDMKNFDPNKFSVRPKISKTIASGEFKKLTPEDPVMAKENGKIINRIIKKAEAETKIILPEGRYCIDSPISLKGKSNITLSAEGEGATLINTSYTPFGEGSPNMIDIFGCENIQIENISFDYKAFPTAEGVIVGQTDTATTFRVYEEYLKGEKDRLLGGEVVTSVFTADLGGFKEEAWPESPLKLQKENEENFSIPLKIGQVGDKIACRLSGSGHYVINVTNTAGLILKAIRCYSCPGGFVLATEGNSDLGFFGLRTEVAEGSERLLSSNEDCLHLRNVAGKLILSGSTFLGIGDDALNIHSAVVSVSETKGNELRLGGNPLMAYLFAKPQETVELFDRNYNSLGLATVKKRGFGEITLAQLTEAQREAVYLQNVSLSPDTYISGCRVGFARARGFLIQSKNCIIKNCDFEDIRLSAVLAAPDFGYWLEGGFCDNLLIENNRFKNCVTAGNDMGVVQIGSAHDSLRGNGNCTLGHKNITLRGNLFENCTEKDYRYFNVMNFINEDIVSEISDNKSF